MGIVNELWSKEGARNRAIMGLGIFFVLSGVVWFLKETLVQVFFGFGQYGSTEDQVAILLFAFISVVIGLVCFVVYTQYEFSRETALAAEHLVADLALSAHQLQLLYDNSPVPYFVMDDTGNVRNANKAALRFFAAKPDDFQVANLYSLASGVRKVASNESVAMLTSKVQRGVPIVDEEVFFKTYAGEERVALMSVYSLDRRSPMPYKHLVALHDVTKEREAEQVKTDFLLLASHQLRTPTTTIKWYIDYLLTTKSVELDGVLREYLEGIQSANERMIDLVSTLLTVSHIEMGTLAPECAHVNLGEVVGDILHELGPDVRKKGVSLTKEVPESVNVYTDRKMLRIAIHNLLTNAIKYTPRGGTIALVASSTSGECVLRVQDSGIGIPMDEQEKIFMKMFRASNAQKISVSGTGLGLYLTRSFVQKLGGDISFESTEGKGSTFTITLPVVATRSE